MGRYYFGDIEGKLWFGIQNSDDADFFGVEHQKNYNRKCGCWYSEADECCCEVEHVHITEDDVKENKDKVLVVCQPDCDKQFDENGIDEESYNSIEYNFTEENIETVKEGIEKCFEMLEKEFPNIREILNCANIDDFIDNIPGIHDFKNCISEWGARLYLGVKILKCLEENGSCNFECEL